MNSKEQQTFKLLRKGINKQLKKKKNYYTIEVSQMHIFVMTQNVLQELCKEFNNITINNYSFCKNNKAYFKISWN